MWKRIFTIGLTAMVFLMAIAIKPSAARGDVDSNQAAFIGVWRLALTPGEDTARDGAKAFNDSLSFEETEIMAEAFAQYGFSSDGYWTYTEGPSFWGMMSSNSKGYLYWEGTLGDGRMTGDVLWVKQDGTVWFFTFTGTRAN